GITGAFDCTRMLPEGWQDCRQTYVDAIYQILSYLWGLWGAVILLCFVIAAVIVFAWRRARVDGKPPPVFASLGVILLQFVLWTAIVGTGVMPLLYRAEEIKGINVLKQADSQSALSAWAEKDPSAKKLLKVVAWDPHKSQWIDRVAFGYGFNGVMILAYW